MIEFAEGDMLFRFSKDITVCKYDETKFYRGTMLRVEGSKAVDFILIRPGSGLPGDVVFIEVKDLSGHESRNRERLLSGRLASEVAQKVRDTISGLFAAWRWDVQELRPFASALFQNTNPLRIEVVLFLEERKSASLLFPYKRRLADQIQLLNNRLRPFRAECKIYNSKTLPSSYGWKGVRRASPHHE
ncbi:hypothetical protein SAMN05660653_01983 [Desulfonatronum thiosulfatophilum]|uniref:Uncharacterized protein n=1 Tax=Desulfonatronum thiosulfatophilum TaxID=617002 RepID=A0A1G6D7F2_9BACT|nr:hypothetical protein [Desulfonatronum thiosulfatophilum]SDB41087.1 hypothetical protein SAMN05660653_01983 [Desulfonatronum thiosulfatophilum]